jgi:hypothetical protein
MRTTIVLTAAALVVTGCTPETARVRPGPPARAVIDGRLPEQPFHDAGPPPGGRHELADLDQADPAEVAIDRIAARLAAQGLEIDDLGIATIARADDRVTLRVAATHRTGPAATPYTSVYELDLTRGPDGHWSVTRSRTVG